MKNNDSINYSDPQIQVHLLNHLRDLYPAKTAITVLDKTFKSFDFDNNLKKLVLSDPRIYRLILTIYYEPVEDWTFRLKLWCIPIVFEINSDQLIDFIIEDEYYIIAARDYYYRSLAEKHPALNSFFSKLYEDFIVAMRADFQKSMGRVGSIAELRAKQFQTKEYRDGNILINETSVDNWPNATIKHLMKTDGSVEYESHIYLNQDSVENWEHGADKHLVSFWWTWHNFPKKDKVFGGLDLDKELPFFTDPKVTVFLYSKEGKLLKKYPFALIPKYAFFIKAVKSKIQEWEEQLIPYHPFDLTINDIQSVFFELAIEYNPTKHGFFAGYMKSRLYSKLRDVREKGILRIDIEYGNHTDRLDEPIGKDNDSETMKHELLWQDTPAPSFDFMAQDKTVPVKIALEKWLSDPKNQKIFELYVNEYKSQKEVAKKMGISQQAVSKRLKNLDNLFSK